jgi:hypothetical protein
MVVVVVVVVVANLGMAAAAAVVVVVVGGGGVGGLVLKSPFPCTSWRKRRGGTGRVQRRKDDARLLLLLRLRLLGSERDTGTKKRCS